MSEWRPIQGYEGLYEICDDGRVRSLERTVIDNLGRPHPIEGRTLIPTPTRRPKHLRVGLSRDNKTHNRFIHQMVLETFVSPRPTGLIACHRDGDVNNNCVSNLYWGTYRDNYLDAVEHGTHWNVNFQYAPTCQRDHEMTPENTYWYGRTGRPKTGRQCRKCKNIRQRKSWKGAA